MQKRAFSKIPDAFAWLRKGEHLVPRIGREILKPIWRNGQSALCRHGLVQPCPAMPEIPRLTQPFPATHALPRQIFLATVVTKFSTIHNEHCHDVVKRRMIHGKVHACNLNKGITLCRHGGFMAA